MQGRELIDTLVAATGLPEEPLREEIFALLERVGKKPEDIGLEDIRHLLAEYLQDTIITSQEKFS